MAGGSQFFKKIEAISGNGWNEFLCMILAEPKIWEKLIKVSYLLYKI